MTVADSRQKLPWALIGLIVIGALLRAPQIHYGSPIVRDPDSGYTVVGSHRLAAAWRAGQLELDPGVYYYPTFYTNLVAAVGFIASPHNMEEKGRAVSVLALLGLIPAAFFIARRVSGRSAALLAGALTSFGFFFIKQGIRPAPDALQTLAVVLALLPLMRGGRLRARDAVVSGLLAGVGAGTKYTAVVFVAPALGLLELFHFLTGDRRGALERIVIWSAAVVGGFALSSPQFFLFREEFLRHLKLQSEIQHGGPIVETGKTAVSLLFSRTTTNVESPFANSLAGMMGLPFVILSLAAVLWSLRRAVKLGDARFAALAFAAIASYAFFAGVSKVAEVRYLLPTAVILTVLVAAMIVASAESALRRTRRPWVATLIVAVAVVFTFGPSIARDKAYLRMLRQPDARVRCAEWILGNVPPGERLLTLMYAPSLPGGRYQPVQWTFPEYAFELSRPDAQPPTLERLRAEKIPWVIWSDFYAQRFLNGKMVPAAENYAAGWRRFYADIGGAADRKERFDGAGTVGPTLEIFHVPPEKAAT